MIWQFQFYLCNIHIAEKVYRPKITTLETTILLATTTPTTVSTTTSTTTASTTTPTTVSTTPSTTTASTTTASTTTTSTTTASTTISTTTKLSCSSFHPVASLVTFYRNSCLRFVKGDKSWNAANAECMKQGGGLLQIHSLQDQEYVFEKLKSLHWSDSGVWIGASDGDSEGRWKWSNGSPLTYSHWSSGEGPQHNATNENCAIVNADDGMWYDYNCEEVIYNQAYICQY
ncbi:galactose-specific lectin nattectin-like [Pecten maximus]|uniref:galactose-specific lectin nattectin-like n=1 Tax=Pecten maximus TaxID=6579 RepID=UPI0014584CD7|nr:galactose-specific lectin nattectin-like [Pecten maximus]